MNDETQTFLLKCKDAGYERVTILVRDKRIPRSKTIKSGAWFGDKPTAEDMPNTPIKVICGYPGQLGKCQGLPGNNWPQMWSIVNECGLTAGLLFGGSGLGDCHDIHPLFCRRLTAGYYDLVDIAFSP